MLFTSYAFIGFAALLLLLYYALPKKVQWPLLLIASWIFYLAAGVENIVYILTTTLTTFLAAIEIENLARKQKDYLKEHKEFTREEKKEYKESQKKIRLRWVAACIVLNLAILAVVKYSNFFVENVNGILRSAGSEKRLSFLSIALPLGISFYTFQSIGYLVDVYRGTVEAQRNFFKFALFTSFFPALVQGPINRYGDLSRTLYEPHSYDSKTVSYGLQRVLWGYFKKMVIADRVLAGVVTIVGDVGTYNGAYVFAGMFLYTLQLYADFTGGIDITIGLSESLGITVKENFDRPYFSKSLKEYWRRWHISMCSWFRDYLFYPVSISKPMQKLLKFSKEHFGDKFGKRVPVYLSSFIVWFATGLWHGASWNFIVWGLCNWAVLMISEELEPLYDRFHKRFPGYSGTWVKIFQVARTFMLVCIMNLFDCYHSISETLQAFGSMFTASNWNVLYDGSLLNIGLSMLDYVILAVGTIIMFTASMLQRKRPLRDSIAELSYPLRFTIFFGIFLIILLMGAYGVGYDSSQFIYNQF